MSTSDAEIEAAKNYLDACAELARRDQPVPRTVIAGMLGAAAHARAFPERAATGETPTAS